MEKASQILDDFMSFLPLALLFSYVSHRISRLPTKNKAFTLSYVLVLGLI